MKTPFSCLLLSAGLWFGAGCAVAVGNPGEPKGKLAALTGMIVNMEDQRPLAAQVRLEEFDTGVTNASNADNAGRYAFHALPLGIYTIRIGPTFSYQIPVSMETRFDIFLPTPAAPGDARALWVNSRLCVLWEDRSGLEAGFKIHTPTAMTAPANAVGAIFTVDEMSTDETTIVTAFNEYGDSATAFAYPHEPLLSLESDFVDAARCHAADLEGIIHLDH